MQHIKNHHVDNVTGVKENTLKDLGCFQRKVIIQLTIDPKQATSVENCCLPNVTLSGKYRIIR